MDKSDQALLANVNLALEDVKRLMDRRLYLERKLLLCEIELKEKWKLVPKMPVRSAEEIDIAERINEKRSTRLMKAARGDQAVASILDSLLYGPEARSVWRQ